MRIRGGKFAYEGQFPFVAKLLVTVQVIDGQTMYMHCGAAILSDRLLLTAAHCLADRIMWVFEVFDIRCRA